VKTDEAALLRKARALFVLRRPMAARRGTGVVYVVDTLALIS
jgi:hypothetical protein